MTTSRSLSSPRAAQASARSRMPRGAVCTPGRRRTAAGLPCAAGCSGVTCHATVTSDTPPRACIHACMQIACKRLLSFSLTSVDQRAARAAAVSFREPGPSSTNFPNLSRPCRCDAIRAYQSHDQSPGVRMCLSVRCVRAYNSVADRTRRALHSFCYIQGFRLALLTKWRPRTPNTTVRSTTRNTCTSTVLRAQGSAQTCPQLSVAMADCDPTQPARLELRSRVPDETPVSEYYGLLSLHGD